MKLFTSIYLKRDTNKWSIYTLAIVICISIPILTIFFKLFSGPGETWSHLVEYVLADYILNSLWLVIGCSITTVFIGVSSAWIVSRYDIPFRKIIEWMLILPLAIPSYINAYVYAGIFDYGGSLELLLRLLGLPPIKLNIMNIFGLIFVLSLSLFPYIYVSARAVFLYQSSRLIEASKLLGASEKNTFYRIVLPIARPAIVGGLILVLMEVLNDYGAAKYFGVSTFTTGIFRSWFSLGEPSTAVYLSAVLLIVVFILMYLERLQRGAKSYSNSYKSNTILKKKKISINIQFLAMLIISMPIIFGFLIPLIQLIYWSFLTYKDVISTSFLTIALQSLGISFLTAFLTVLVALMTLYFPKWNRLKLLKKISRITILGYAIPGAIIAVGIMIPSLMIDKWFIKIAKTVANIKIGFVINGTIIILVYAYVIRFLAVAFNPIEANQLKIGDSLSESSKLLSTGPLKTFFKIELPLLKSGAIGAFILVFVDVMKELPLTLILKPYQVNTLAVKAYEYASDELIMESALPSLCIIITGIIPIILLNRLIMNKQ